MKTKIKNLQKKVAVNPKESINSIHLENAIAFELSDSLSEGQSDILTDTLNVESNSNQASLLREDQNSADDFNGFFGVREIVDVHETKEEEGLFKSLRPSKMSEYVGQEKLIANLSIAISAAKKRKESLDHVLFHGPPGLGKTTLAVVIAEELGVSLKATSGPVLERPGDLAAILSSLGPHDVLFIDEIHRLQRSIEEILYPAMEDYHIDIIIGQGASARSVKLPLKPFTLVGATTRTGLLTAPLRDRFGIVERLEFYKEHELIRIIERSAKILNIEIEEVGASEIARRSRGTPRITNRLLKRVRDYAQERADSIISEEVAQEALELLDIDKLGLDKMDRNLMLTIIDKFRGGPVGLDTLAASLNEDKDTIEDIYEPYLMQLGFIARTPRGREATYKAYQYFERTAEYRQESDGKLQQRLF